MTTLKSGEPKLAARTDRQLLRNDNVLRNPAPWTTMRRLLVSQSFRRAAATAGIVFTIVACGSSTSRSSIEQRVSGWWVDPQVADCYCPSDAECEAGDCAGYVVLGLLPSHRYIDGRIAWSRKRGTMSSTGTFASGTWKVIGNKVVIAQPGVEDIAVPVSFRADGALVFRYEVQTRPPASLSNALTEATLDGGTAWRGVAVSP